MNSSRRWTLRLTAATCVLALSSLPAFTQSAKQPNILFVFADDHAYQAISAYGSMINHTPNIDRLAREGMLFESCMVTNSICAPSRAVILSGKYSHLNGVLDNRIPFDGSQQTFPKLLQKAGYQTAIVGKWHLKTDPTGFDYWEVLPGQGAYYNPDMRIAGGERRHEGYVTNVITDLVLDWFKNKRDPNRPFMVMYQHKAPHRNWMPGPEHLTLYDGMDIWEPPTLFDDYTHRASPARLQAMEIGRHMTDGGDLKLNPLPDAAESPAAQQWMRMRARLTESQQRIWDAVYEPKNQAFRKEHPIGRDLVRWKYQRYIKDYLRTIASIDDNLGRVLRYLDETGLANNTVVIYSSDQGFYLGEHGWFDKRWMYEESLKTALIVRWPRVTEPGSRNNYIVSNLDYAETFLGIAGVEIPADMQGCSLVPQLKGEIVPDWRKSFYYHYYEGGGHGVPPHYGVRTETHKLIRFYESDEWELFDLELDPLELHSVYGEERYELVQKELHAELDRLRAELKVPEKDPDL
jgi:arylsulfatase A-like enzyme